MRVLVVDDSRAVRMITREIHTGIGRHEAVRTLARIAAVRVRGAAPLVQAHSSPKPPAAPASVRVITRPTPAGLQALARARVGARTTLPLRPTGRVVT